ncbi:complex I assembly factor ACAD9, mitochondrial-like [Nilaparvata lugens]|nr:complex I assembly factor ACAD9, mitochondrial-like [Nilaparvata lugens]
MTDISVIARPTPDKKWSLSGTKMWVANADKSDYFLVVARTWVHKIEELDSIKTSVFIVDKSSNGIKISEPVEQLGSRGISICNVTFEDTIVGEDDLLGNIGDGYDIAVNSLSKGKLARAASRVGLLKKIANMVTEYAIQTKTSGLSLTKYELCRYNLGNIMSDVYAIESLVYLIAGNQDDFSSFDCILEELSADIFSLETSFNVIHRCINIIGPQTVLKDSPLERILRDSYSYLLHDLIPTDVKKIYVATNGLQHAGALAYDEVKKARNPFNFPMFTLKSFIKYDNALKEEPKLPGELRQMVHPSLGVDADKLEVCLIRFDYLVKEMMKRWGKELIDRQYELINLSNYATSMLVMTAVLARASRSYCIGIQNADLERTLCSSLCQQHHKIAMRIFDDLNDGPIDTGRAVLLKVGEDAVDKKGYFFSHPLDRNY